MDEIYFPVPANNETCKHYFKEPNEMNHRNEQKDEK